MLTAMGVAIFLRHPDLAAERLAPPEGAESWNKAIFSGIRLLQLIRFVVAGLDQRNGWTGGIPFEIQLAALVVCLLVYAVFP